MNACLFRAILGASLAFAAALPAATPPTEIAALRDRAESGNAIAQYNLGLIYADASEPAHDIVEAYIWLSRAARNGARGRQLDSVIERLSLTQRAEADRRLDMASFPAATTPPRISAVPLDGEDAEIVRLRQELSALAAELDQARAQLQQQAATELRKRVAIAEAALDNRNRQVADLETQLAELRPTAGEGPLTSLTRERDDLRGQLATREAELKSSQQAVASAREESVAALTQKGVLHTKLELAETQVTRMAEELATARTAVKKRSADADSRVTRLIAELDSAHAANTQLQSNLADSLAVGEDLLRSSAFAETTIAELESNLGSVQQERDELTAQIQSLAADAAEPSPAMIQLETDLAATAAARDEAMGQTAVLRTEITQLKQDLTAVSRERENLDSRLADALSAGSAHEALADELTAAHQDLADTTGDRDEAMGQTAVLRTEITQLKQDLAAVSRERENLDSRLADALSAGSAHEALADELTAAHQALADTETHLQSIGRERDDLADRLAQAMAQLDSGTAVADQLATIQRDLSSSREEVQSLARERDDAHGRISDLVTALDQSRYRVGLLEAEVTDLPAPAVGITAAAAEIQTRLDSSLRAFGVQQRELASLRTALSDATALASDRDGMVAQLRTELEDAQALAASRAEELADIQATLAAGSADAAARITENVALREDARLAREQAAALSTQLATLRTRLAINQPLARANPGRVTPSRPGNASSSAPFSSPNRRSDTTRLAPPAATGASSTTAEPAGDDRLHTVMAGETLSAISREYYGTSNRWPEILEANREAILDPNALRVGTALYIP